MRFVFSSTIKRESSVAQNLNSNLFCLGTNSKKKLFHFLAVNQSRIIVYQKKEWKQGMKGFHINCSTCIACHRTFWPLSITFKSAANTFFYILMAFYYTSWCETALHISRGILNLANNWRCRSGKDWNINPSLFSFLEYEVKSSFLTVWCVINTTRNSWLLKDYLKKSGN